MYQIAESFRRFGIQDTSTHVVAVKVLKSPDQSVAEHLTTNVQGEPFALTDEALASVKDDARIRKIYRLAQEGRVCCPRKRSGSLRHWQHGAQRSVDNDIMTSC
jgi:hypothetical protein